MAQNNWSEKENNILLNAIETGTSVKHVIEIVVTQTTRSESSVRRRLTKVGFIRKSGQLVSQKRGFVG